MKFSTLVASFEPESEKPNLFRQLLRHCQVRKFIGESFDAAREWK